MGIQRYSASLDTTITNAFKMNLSTRATGSNMGLADTLEVFSIYGQQNSASSELSRVLIQFPVEDIAADRASATIPVSSSVNFFLKMYNAEHSFTVPKDFNLIVSAITRSWQEGYGLDMDEYTDLTFDDVGSNWQRASKTTTWTTAGGDYYHDDKSSFTASFADGTEDLEVDITTLVEQWLTSSGNLLGHKTNYGVGVMLPTGSEQASRSYYTKKFFARSSEFKLRRPVIEARWDSTRKDNQGNFFLSSSLASPTDNLNTIYLYNRVRGQLQNINSVGTGRLVVSIYSGSSDNSAPSAVRHSLPLGGGVAAAGDYNVTGGWVATGIYSASFAFTGSSTTIFPVWHNDINRSTGFAQFSTGSGITVNTLTSLSYNPHPEYALKITNLKDEYSNSEKTTRFRLYVREKDWNPNIYTVASSDINTTIIEDAYYRLYRVVDEFEVVAYGTGSTNHTRLSYDASGSYFDFPMDILAAGYMYSFKFTFKMPDGNYREQSEEFKFRVKP